MKKLVCALLFGALSSISAQQQPVRAAGPQSVRPADSTKKVVEATTKIDTTKAEPIIQQAMPKASPTPERKKTGHPFFNCPATSLEQASSWIKNNVRGKDGKCGLEAPADSIVAAFNRTFDLRLEHPADLAQFILGLQDVNASNVGLAGRLVRLELIRDGGIPDLNGWDRVLQVNEHLACDMEGRCYFSMKCGNPAPNLWLPKRQVAEAPKAVAQVDIPRSPTVSAEATATATATPPAPSAPSQVREGGCSTTCKVLTTLAVVAGIGAVWAGAKCVLVDHCLSGPGDESIHITNINTADRRPSIGFHFAFKTP